jgi:hypothetical protein
MNDEDAAELFMRLIACRASRPSAWTTEVLAYLWLHTQVSAIQAMLALVDDPSSGVIAGFGPTGLPGPRTTCARSIAIWPARSRPGRRSWRSGRAFGGRSSRSSAATSPPVSRTTPTRPRFASGIETSDTPLKRALMKEPRGKHRGGVLGRRRKLVAACPLLSLRVAGVLPPPGPPSARLSSRCLPHLRRPAGDTGIGLVVRRPLEPRVRRQRVRPVVRSPVVSRHESALPFLAPFRASGRLRSPQSARRRPQGAAVWAVEPNRRNDHPGGVGPPRQRGGHSKKFNQFSNFVLGQTPGLGPAD